MQKKPSKRKASRKLVLVSDKLQSARLVIRENELSQSTKIAVLTNRHELDKLRGLRDIDFILCGNWGKLPYEIIQEFFILADYGYWKDVTNKHKV